jgi:hypothetical protein
VRVLLHSLLESDIYKALDLEFLSSHAYWNYILCGERPSLFCIPNRFEGKRLGSKVSLVYFSTLEISS